MRNSLLASNGFKPILSIRALTLFNGQRNNTWAGLTGIDTLAHFDDLAMARGHATFIAVYDPVLTGAVWGPAGVDSAVELDTSATDADITDCSVIATWLCFEKDSHIFKAPSVYDADGVGVSADGSPTTITILAKPFYDEPVTVAAVLSWEELH
jgi:hypothetical protein